MIIAELCVCVCVYVYVVRGENLTIQGRNAEMQMIRKKRK